MTKKYSYDCPIVVAGFFTVDLQHYPPYSERTISIVSMSRIAIRKSGTTILSRLKLKKSGRTACQVRDVLTLPQTHRNILGLPILLVPFIRANLPENCIKDSYSSHFKPCYQWNCILLLVTNCLLLMLLTLTCRAVNLIPLRRLQAFQQKRIGSPKFLVVRIPWRLSLVFFNFSRGICLDCPVYELPGVSCIVSSLMYHGERGKVYTTGGMQYPRICLGHSAEPQGFESICVCCENVGLV